MQWLGPVVTWIKQLLSVEKAGNIIAFTTDCWSGSTEALMSLTAHYIHRTDLWILAKLKIIATHFNHSLLHWRSVIQDEVGVPQHSILQAVPTRWTPHYTCSWGWWSKREQSQPIQVTMGISPVQLRTSGMWQPTWRRPRHYWKR